MEDIKLRRNVVDNLVFDSQIDAAHIAVTAENGVA